MSAEAPHRFRAKAYPRVRHSAVTTHYPPRTAHPLLPETPNRVETHVSHRKQTAGCPSTRDSFHRPSAHQFFALPILAPHRNSSSVSDFRANLQPLTSNVHRLIGTGERLEPRVSHRKQSTACTSNRYSSHPIDIGFRLSSARRGPPPGLAAMRPAVSSIALADAFPNIFRPQRPVANAPLNSRTLLCTEYFARLSARRPRFYHGWVGALGPIRNVTRASLRYSCGMCAPHAHAGNTGTKRHAVSARQSPRRQTGDGQQNRRTHLRA